MVNTKKIINLGNNINLTLIKTEKFKSNLISLYVQRLLDEKEIFENMYQCFGSNGSLAKRMRRSAAEKRREDNDGDCKTGGFYQKKI